MLYFSIVTMSRQRFPCRDRDGHDNRSGVATSLALGEDFMSRQSVFMSQQSLVKTNSFYVVIELAKVKRIYVATEYFCVTTEFGLEWGLYHDRVWPRHGILGHDRVCSCHDRVWRKDQESLRRDREFDVAIEFSKLVSQ